MNLQISLKKAIEYSDIQIFGKIEMLSEQVPVQCLKQYSRPLPENGYFGKPTKFRYLQPSMFDLLTWKVTQEVEVGQKENSRVLANTSMQLHKHGKGNNFQPMDEIPEERMGQQQKRKNSIPEPVQEKKQKERQKGKNKMLGNEDFKRQERRRQINSKKDKQKQNRPQSAPYKVFPTQKLTAKNKKQNNQTINKKGSYEESSFHRQEDEMQREVNKSQLINKVKHFFRQFKQTTRWISNSAFTTYFGKPAFENYGRGNTTPTNGGLIYGNYLKSHNVQPHRGMNSPKNMESYSVALQKAKQMGVVSPYPPKTSGKESGYWSNPPQKRKTQHEHSPIYPVQNTGEVLPIRTPNLYDLEKFGGKGIQKVSKSRQYRHTGQAYEVSR